MGTLTIEMDDDLLAELGKTEEERRAFVLEAIAVDCFQKKEWPTGTCGRLMGIPRVEFVRIQAERGIPSPITGEDIAEGYRAIEKLFPK